MTSLIKGYCDRIKHVVKSTFITSNRIKLSPSSRMGRGVKVQRHSFINLGTTWRLAVSFTYCPLYPNRKSPLNSLNWKLGGRHSRSSGFGEVKHLFTSPSNGSPIVHYRRLEQSQHQIKQSHSAIDPVA